MDCLTKLQIQDFLRGNKSSAYEAHLADCASCRTELLNILAKETPDSFVSPELADKTIDAIAAQGFEQMEKGVQATWFVFPLLARSLRTYMVAACLAAGALICGYFFVKGPFQQNALLTKTTKSISSQTGKNGIGNNEVVPKTVIAVNNEAPKKNAVVVFDSVVVHVGKIPVAKDREIGRAHV